MSELEQTLCTIVFTVLLAVLVVASLVQAHPGALDDSNCHFVKQDWKYKSGKVLKKGSYHCHGRLNDLSLDGRNVLEDPDDKGEPVKKKSKGQQK